MFQKPFLWLFTAAILSGSAAFAEESTLPAQTAQDNAAEAAEPQGTVAAPLSVVNRASRIGKSVILNTSSSVDHDCVVGDFSHVSPGARLAGGVTLGRRCWVGIGACIIEGIKIADDVVIGAGAAVVEDITEPGVYVGVPARRIKP